MIQKNFALKNYPNKHISSVKVKLQSDSESNAAHMSVYFLRMPIAAHMCIFVKIPKDTSGTTSETDYNGNILQVT